MGSDYYKVINHLQKVGFSNHSHCKRKETDEIVFDQRKCKRIGLSASTIMDIIVLAAENYRTRNNSKPINFEGKLPINKEARDIL